MNHSPYQTMQTWISNMFKRKEVQKEEPPEQRIVNVDALSELAILMKGMGVSKWEIGYDTEAPVVVTLSFILSQGLDVDNVLGFESYTDSEVRLSGDSFMSVMNVLKENKETIIQSSAMSANRNGNDLIKAIESLSK